MQDDLPWFTEWVDALSKRMKPDPTRWLYGSRLREIVAADRSRIVLPYWDFAYDVSTHDGAEKSVIWDPKNFGRDGKAKCVDLSKSQMVGGPERRMATFLASLGNSVILKQECEGPVGCGG